MRTIAFIKPDQSGDSTTSFDLDADRGLAEQHFADLVKDGRSPFAKPRGAVPARRIDALDGLRSADREIHFLARYVGG